jgi:hypothetical protein
VKAKTTVGALLDSRYVLNFRERLWKMMNYGNEDGTFGLSSHFIFVSQLGSSLLVEDKSMITAVM